MPGVGSLRLFASRLRRTGLDWTGLDWVGLDSINNWRGNDGRKAAAGFKFYIF